MKYDSVYSAYKAIHTAWDNNVSFGDMYDMIVDWIEDWSPELIHPEVADLIEDYIGRCENDDEMHDLVEEFIYGEEYAPIREIFLRE